MRLKLLLLSTLLVVGVSSSKTDYTCAHDGYSNADGKCECTSSTYKDKTFNFYSGSKCSTIECTNSGVRVSDEFDDNNQRCSCPPGFLGTHCEPMHCVADEVKSFELLSHGRDVSVIITYNKEFQQQVAEKDKNQNLPGTICDAISDPDNGVSADSKIHFYFMETDISTNVEDCKPDVKNSLAVCEGGFCDGNLTIAYIKEALETMGEDSRLIILSNEGIQDELAEEGIEAVRKQAISLRIQIHSIVLSPRQPNNNNIYFNNVEFKLLRDLSESTLGFFITPFDASGGQKLGRQGMSDILKLMMPVFFDYVVVDRITTNTTSCDLATDFTVFKTMELEKDIDWKFWLTVTSNGANYASYSTQWIGAPVDDPPIVNSGYFKAYTLAAHQGQVVALKPYSKLSNKCVPTTIMSQHLARFAITIDDAIDASSPFAISGASNTLVGHFVKDYHEDLLKNLYLEFSNNNFTADLDREPIARPCQYNSKFSDVSCDEGANTLIRVRDRVSGAAVTVQSLYCTESEVAPKTALSRDFIPFEMESDPVLTACDPTVEVVKGKRSLILAAHATDNIYKLFNGNSKSAIKYLNDLADSEHYNNYVVNIFNANDGTDAESYPEYGDFKAHLMEKWNVIYNPEKDEDCKAQVTEKNGSRKNMDALLPLVDILSPGTKTTPNSDIIYIFDQAIKNTFTDNDGNPDVDTFNNELKDLQRQMYQKRLRLIVLILGCDNADFSDSMALKNWNTAAMKTGGFVLHFAEPDKLNEFLASYVTWVKGETASSIDGQDLGDGMPFSFDSIKSTPFQVKEGRNYTILVNTLPSLTNADILDATDVDAPATIETIERNAAFGNSLSVFEYQAKEDGILSVQVTPYPYFYYSAIRVLDYLEEEPEFATIGFTRATCLDSTYPDFNPKEKLQIPVSSTVKDANVSITIYTSDGKVLKTDEVATSVDTSVGTNEPLQLTNYPLNGYNWRCNDKDHVFYVSTDVIIPDTTAFSRVITTQCFGSDDTDPCINGDYDMAINKCHCPHDYTGDLCDIPVCQNGGTPTSSLECDCTDDYTGFFCQKYKSCDDKQSSFTPAYKSIANTIIFLVEKSQFVVNRIQKLKDTDKTTAADLFSGVRAAQYLIVEYGPESNYTVRLSTTDKDLLYNELIKIEAVADHDDTTYFDAIPAIKAVLQAQTTDSAHLFWFAQDDSIGDFVSEVFEPIATNRVTISAFFGVRDMYTPPTPAPDDDGTTPPPPPAQPVYAVHPVTLTGGSIFYSEAAETDYVDYFYNYVIALLTFKTGFEHRPNTLSIATTVSASTTGSTTTYTTVHTINIDANVDKLFIAADVANADVHIVLQSTGECSSPKISDHDTIPGGAVYDAPDAGEYTVIITYPNGDFNRTSSVIALSWTQAAYGFYRSDESDVFMDSAMMGNNVLVTYWLSEGDQFAPSAVITPMSVDGAGQSWELYMTQRDKCSYTLSVPVDCTGDEDAFGVKITNSIIGKNGKGEFKVDKYIPVLCMSAHECHNGGVPTDSGCNCTYYYDGLYCENDKCANGEKSGDSTCVCNTGYSGEFCDTFKKPSDRAGVAFLFIQDVCGTDENLKDTAQNVYVDYFALFTGKNNEKFFLATNAAGTAVVPILTAADLTTALADNRKAAGDGCDATIGDALDAFYDVLRKSGPSSISAEAAADPSIGKANVAHVTTVPVDANQGASLKRLQNDFILNMEFVGFTDKNVYFDHPESFGDFPGEFTQTYDEEAALLDLVNTYGSDTKPVTPSLDKYPRCINKLQADFAFHTDISSVQKMTEYRSKAAKVITNVVKYFDIPDVKNIDLDDDTCEFNKDQLEDKTQFYGVIYANSSGIGTPTFCMSNMNSYPDTVNKADYKQTNQVMLQPVIDSFTKWYNSELKMMCHCFDSKNEKTTKIIMWTPLSPTSLDTTPVSFAGFDVVHFKHIVMPFGFSYKDSALWRSLVPDESMWTGDASQDNYDVDQIVQDIWTITCRMAGHIDSSETAEPYNPYTTKKPRVPGDNNFRDDVTDEPSKADDPVPR